MTSLTPSLWFDHTADDAVAFYLSAFPDSRLLDRSSYPTEGLAPFQADLAGLALSLSFELGGQPFLAINAGPEFRPNPSISFMVNYDPSRDPQARDHLNALWATLAADGEILMDLAAYEFSPLYGWVADRYGVSWQLILTDPAGQPRPFIVPSLMFGSVHVNQAREALDYYTRIFPDSQIGTTAPYATQTGQAKAGSLMFGEAALAGNWIAVMDSGVEQDFTFNEAISFVLSCADQAEIDHYWDALSAVPEAEACGWAKDRFGVSWQIVPANLGDLMARPGSFERLMGMKKIDIAAFTAG